MLGCQSGGMGVKFCQKLLHERKKEESRERRNHEQKVRRGIEKKSDEERREVKHNKHTYMEGKDKCCDLYF